MGVIKETITHRCFLGRDFHEEQFQGQWQGHGEEPALQSAKWALGPRMELGLAWPLPLDSGLLRDTLKPLGRGRENSITGSKGLTILSKTSWKNKYLMEGKLFDYRRIRIVHFQMTRYTEPTVILQVLNSPLQIILATFSASAGDCKSLTRTAYLGSVVIVRRSSSGMFGLPTAITCKEQ